MEINKRVCFGAALRPGAHFHSFRSNGMAGQREPESCWHWPSCYCGKATITGQEKEVGTKSVYIKGSEWKKHKCCQNSEQLFAFFSCFKLKGIFTSNPLPW